MAKIITAYVHDLLQQVDKGEISSSRMVELINEKATEPTKGQETDAEIEKFLDNYAKPHKAMKEIEYFKNHIWETSPAVGVTLKAMKNKINELVDEINDLKAKLSGDHANEDFESDEIHDSIIEDLRDGTIEH